MRFQFGKLFISRVAESEVKCPTPTPTFPKFPTPIPTPSRKVNEVWLSTILPQPAISGNRGAQKELYLFQ